MTFDSLERSVSGSQPIETWTITTPVTTYRKTTAEIDQVISAQTYTAVAGARSDVSAASITDPPEMVLTLPVSDDFVQAFAFEMPPQTLDLVIRRYQGSASMVWWTGPISAFTVKGDWCTIRSPSQLSDALETTIPSAHVQRQCNHVLFDDRCSIDGESAANKLSTTITAISSDGLSVTVSSVGTLGPKLKSGHATLGVDGDHRLILDRTGLVLRLNAPFRSAAVSGVIVLRRGCNHDIADCVATYSNAINFGGHPYMPLSNPWVGGIIGKFPA